ncbi:ABC transporter ATP-binding protein [Thermostichus vulcanus]|uniref:ABC transporter ATP-binding protein n=1 Tax=Thermostichus vulcanus str. 'Rupite' TaxID=2813851 RepID=A0ABT0CC93_THEVL|nr:ABC transporter ATP-binding protein [Thermostichus vulcanus]MCJ2543344.1 ABC transporter ATP-binding protein [Thermostichus vulcanus str. 'Rupite']
MKALEAEHLKKSYQQGGKTVQAVVDVSLAIAAGEVLAFLGPNGAGKTTTIKMIAGLIRPDAGRVRIVGRDPHREEQALAQVGAVLEGNRNLYWRLTPLQNLEYFGVLRGLTAKTARQRGLELLETFGLMEKQGVAVQTLSRGMQQKLAIATALIHRPALLLLDEPTLGLDVEAAQTVKSLIRHIAAAGQAILLTTHQLDIAEVLSDQVAVIQQGVIIAQAPTRELIRHFAGAASTYHIELEQAIDSERATQLGSLGVVVEEPHRLRFTGSSEELYRILDKMNPIPLLSIKRAEADLTHVFLKLLRKGNRQG